MKKQLLSFITASLCVFGGALPYIPASETITAQAAASLTDNFEYDGYNYRLFSDNDLKGLKYEKGSQGTLKGSWDNITDAFMAVGKEFVEQGKTYSDIGRINIDYAVDIDADSAVYSTKNVTNSFIYGAYGLFEKQDSVSSQTEWFIIDGRSNWTLPSKDAKPIGSLDSNGNTYDIYKTQIYSSPGAPPIVQYWSIRRVNPISDGQVCASGNICINDHMKAWKKCGLDVDIPLYSVNTCIESFNAESGKFSITKNDIIIDGGKDVIKGDINGDKKVNVFDVVLFRKEIAKILGDEKAVSEADIDGDGKVRINDLLRLAKFVTGKTDRLVDTYVEPIGTEVPRTTASKPAVTTTVTTVTALEPNLEYSSQEVKNGYAYRIWNQDQNDTAEIIPWYSERDGAYMCNWIDTDNALFMSEMAERPSKFDLSTGDILVDYDAELEAHGGASVSVYGWCKNPYIEWYIVEGLTDNSMYSTEKYKNLGAFTSNGKTYDVYHTIATSSPTVHRYVCVNRDGLLDQENRNYISGTVNVTDCLTLMSEIAKCDIGQFIDVSLCVEALNSEDGDAYIKKNDIIINGIPFNKLDKPEEPEQLTNVEEMVDIKSIQKLESYDYTASIYRPLNSDETDKVSGGFGYDGQQIKGEWDTKHQAFFDSCKHIESQTYPVINDFTVEYDCYIKSRGGFALGATAVFFEPDAEFDIIEHYGGDIDFGKYIGDIFVDNALYKLYVKQGDGSHIIYSCVSSSAHTSVENYNTLYSDKININDFLKAASKFEEVELGKLNTVTATAYADNGSGTLELTKTFITEKKSVETINSEFEMQNVDGTLKGEADGFIFEAFADKGYRTDADVKVGFGEHGGLMRGVWNSDSDVVFTSGQNIEEFGLNHRALVDYEYTAAVDAPSSSIWNLGVQLLFQNKQAEVDIIDYYSGWNPTENSEKIGTIKVKTETYTVYKEKTKYPTTDAKRLTRYILLSSHNRYYPDSEAVSRKVDIKSAVAGLLDCGINLTLDDATYMGIKFNAFDCSGSYSLINQQTSIW